MIASNEFLPFGYQHITQVGLRLSSPLTDESFALLDGQKAFLADDFDYGDRPAIALYHVMHEAHVSFPYDFGLPPVLTQAMACMLSESLEDNAPLHVYAWDLLPTVVLLASKFPQLTITLPVGGFSKPYPAYDYEPIFDLLKRIFPQATWKTSSLGEFNYDTPPHLLGFSPFQLLKFGFVDFQQIAMSKSASFVVYRSSLRGARHRSIRKKCVEKRLVHGAILLPTLSSAMCQNIQFAILKMGEARQDDQTVRMALIDDNKDERTALTPERIVSLLDEATDTDFEKGSMDVPFSEIDDNISPCLFFTNRIIERNSRPLGDFADILRCQALRHVLPTAQRTAWGSLGEGQPFFARDIRQQDLDNDTGFVPADDGVGTYVKLPPAKGREGYDKYALRQNDILFAFRGSPLSIGDVGFVAEVGKTAIPGALMCIIRARNPFDAVWLYHYLRQLITQEWIVKNSSGAGVTKTLTTSMVASIPIIKPSLEDISTIMAYHNNVVAASWSIRNQRLSMNEQIKMIDEAFRLPSD